MARHQGIAGSILRLIILGVVTMRLLGRPLPLIETDRAALIVVLGLAAIKIGIAAVVPLRVSRVLAALAVTSTMAAFYLVRGRRLLAPIVAHWLSDAGTAFLATLVPRLRQSRHRAGHP